MSRYNIYLKDILTAIKQIENVQNDKLKKSYAWDIILMRLQVIGESVKKIPKNVKDNYPEIDWKELSFLRNIISHAYFRVLPEMVDKIIKEDIPKLKKVVKKIR